MCLSLFNDLSVEHMTPEQCFRDFFSTMTPEEFMEGYEKFYEEMPKADVIEMSVNDFIYDWPYDDEVPKFFFERISDYLKQNLPA